MPTDFSIYRLLTPGPVPLAPQVLNALAQPMRHHRTPEFIKTLAEVWQGLKWFFHTEQPVLILNTCGSGAMEAALVNTLSADDEVLSVVSGKFGERWAEIAKIYKLHVHELSVPWGQAVNPEDVKAFLKKHPKIKAVLCQAVETSTATVHPIKELAQVIKENSSALFMVDAITGVGAMPLPMDKWGLDIVIAGSQKALMLPTGIAFIALSKQAWQANKTATLPRFYLDLANELKANSKGQTYFSSANSHIVALAAALAFFKTKGLPWVQGRCALLAEVTRKGGHGLGLEIYSQAPASSVTALLVPEKMDSTKIRDHLEAKYNITVMGGQDQLQGKILRIGHLGYIRNSDMFALFDGLGRTFIDLQMPQLTLNKVESVIALAEQLLKPGPHVD